LALPNLCFGELGSSPALQVNLEISAPGNSFVVVFNDCVYRLMVTEGTRFVQMRIVEIDRPHHVVTDLSVREVIRPGVAICADAKTVSTEDALTLFAANRDMRLKIWGKSFSDPRVLYVRFQLPPLNVRDTFTPDLCTGLDLMARV
jgi:hypothetical protein